MLCHLLGYDMLLDSFPCIVLVLVPLHHPDGQRLGRERQATSANPLAPAVKHEGTDGTKRRGIGAWNPGLPRGWSCHLLGTPHALQLPLGPRAPSWAATEPLECTDDGSSGYLKVGAQQQDNRYFSYDGGTQKLRAYILASAALHPASHSAPPWASQSAHGRRYFPPGRWARSSPGLSRAAFRLLLRGPQGPRWPLAAARWAERTLSCAASWLQGFGRLRVGTRGDKDGSPRPVPTGPRGRLSFCSRPPLTDAQGGLVCVPRRLPGLEGRPAPEEGLHLVCARPFRSDSSCRPSSPLIFRCFLMLYSFVRNQVLWLPAPSCCVRKKRGSWGWHHTQLVLFLRSRPYPARCTTLGRSNGTRETWQLGEGTYLS